MHPLTILMHMRTTLIIDDEILSRARRLSGIAEKTAVVHAGLEALIAREKARGVPAAVHRAEEVFREAERDAAEELASRGAAPVITGERIMELTGLAPGPRVGEIQRRVREWALDDRVADRDRIEAQVRRIAAQGPG